MAEEMQQSEFQIEQTSPAGANLFRIEFGNDRRSVALSRANVSISKFTTNHLCMDANSQMDPMDI